MGNNDDFIRNVNDLKMNFHGPYVDVDDPYMTLLMTTEAPPSNVYNDPKMTRLHHDLFECAK